jgi:membrane protease YdiL (CAAX protease family)
VVGVFLFNQKFYTMKKSFFIFLGYVALFFVLSIGLLVSLLKLFLVFGFIDESHSYTDASICGILLMCCTTILSGILLVKIYHWQAKPLQVLSYEKPLRFFIGAWLGAILYLPIFLVFAYRANWQFEVALQTNYLLMAVFVFSVLASAWLEEIAFRYIGLGVLEKHFSVVQSILISSLIFAMMHVDGLINGYPDAWKDTFVRFAMGVFFALMYKRKGIWATTGLHFMWNILQYAIDLPSTHQHKKTSIVLMNWHTDFVVNDLNVFVYLTAVALLLLFKDQIVRKVVKFE